VKSTSVAVSDVEFNPKGITMDKDTEILNADLSVVGCILLLMFICYMYAISYMYQNKLSEELYQAKEYAVYYYDTTLALEDKLEALKQELNNRNELDKQKDQLDAEAKKIKRIIKDLSQDTQKKKKLKD